MNAVFVYADGRTVTREAIGAEWVIVPDDAIKTSARRPYAERYFVLQCETACDDEEREGLDVYVERPREAYAGR